MDSLRRVTCADSLLVRWYAPSAEFTNGVYQYPLVEKIDAIV